MTQWLVEEAAFVLLEVEEARAQQEALAEEAAAAKDEAREARLLTLAHKQLQRARR